MGFHVLPERAGVCVALVAAPEFAEVWLVTGVDMAVLLAVGTVGESAVTSGKLTGEGFLSCMGSFVDFEIFASCENFPTPRKWTGEGFLSCMYSNMVDQFILGLKRSAMSGTFLP